MLVLTLVAALGAALFAYLYPPARPDDSGNHLTYYCTDSDTHEFKTVLNSEVFADLNPNLLVTEQTARDAATAYIEKQVAEGTVSTPHGISYVIPTSVWTVNYDYWLVRFHLDDDYTSRNFIEILVRMDGVVIEPAVEQHIDKTETIDPLDTENAG